MKFLDWLICVAYLVLSLALGMLVSRRGAKNIEEFFVSGRSLPWWLAGTSMAATTFSIDTPLYVAGIVGKRGVAGNWEWWSFAIAHVVMIYVFARLWRRSQVVTDAELIELRYGGRVAAWLRGAKAFLFAVPINCIGIGYAMLAAAKTVDALGIWQGLGVDAGENLKLWSICGISILVLAYTGFAGLWGVVVTDFFQFFLALFGAVVVAAIALDRVGGIHTILPAVQELTPQDALSLVPFTWTERGLAWAETAGISASTFFAYIFIQWWSFRRSDGGGEFIQRLVAAKDEAEAEKAAWWFNILNYVVRPWPWIVVALVAIALYPDLTDKELGYPMLMVDVLPTGMLGLVVASLLAAFMSTVSTSINWGASYLTHDLYHRFLRPEATQAELMMSGRIASVLVTVFGAIAAFYATDITQVFQLVIAIGTGPGVVLVLRWFWWRINAAAELAAMVGGFVVGLATSVVPVLKIEDFGWRLMVTSAITAAIWIPILLLTAPETDDTLNQFYRRVRPSGLWQRQQEMTGLRPAQNLVWDLKRAIAALLLLLGSMLAVGGFLLLQPFTGWLSLLAASLGGVWLRRLSKERVYSSD